jgi:type VI secretion system protein ImpC
MAEEASQPQEQGAEATEGSLLDQIMSQTNMTPSEEAYDVTKKGLAAFIGQLLESQEGDQKADKKAVDALIAQLDEKLSTQIDQILHHPDVQKLESAWRGLKLVVDRTDFRENIKIDLLNVSKDDLLEDFEDAPEITQSGLYKQVYTNEYGQFGGEPYASMVGNYDFGPGPQDVALLQNVASVATMAHAPFVASAGAKFFGIEDFRRLPNLKDLQSTFEGPQYIKWQSFRESEDARSVGLTVPRFLLRLPYDPEANPVKAFNYKETIDGEHDRYLWGNTAYAFATRLTDSFAKFRWCPNIIGPQSGGAVEDLPLHQYQSMGEIETKIPTETLISDRQEYELAEQGFIPLTFRKGSDNACFFSANSAQKPKNFGQSAEGKEAEMNFRLGTQLPYMYVVNRLAHYIKVLQREQIGSWKEREDLDRELNQWISQYVSEQDNPSPSVRSRRPLRAAQIIVDEVPGEAGWYRVQMKVRPHFKYMGASFTLSLVGKLDKS